ncbi:MAG: MMPL family transporter [Clostridiales bacterium]|nr:MMPL family transporter [Clostridiales bacterium]
MLRLGRAITEKRKGILIIALLLLIPAVFGIMGTRINYDVLTYLPDDIQTVKGQNILIDDFGKGAFSMVMVDGMDTKNVAGLKSKIEGVDHVDSVIWYDSVLSSTVPMEVLPEDVYHKFNSGDTTLMAVFFDTSTSADESLQAIEDIRGICGEKCFISGMSAMVTDLKDLVEHEEPIYVAIAVILACTVLALFMDSWVIPFIFVAGIGITILYNLGSNVFMGEVSYITKAISAVLQLGVTMDYSIFLWHSYEEHRQDKSLSRDEAMSKAIAGTITAVAGSSITTIAGFLAMCFMTFALGLDLGIVMAKGVLLGVLGSVTILPAMIMTFEKLIEKTRHKGLVPNFGKISNFVTKKPRIFVGVFVILLIPAIWGYSNTDVYYNLDKSVPQSLPFKVAANKLDNEFDMNTTHMLLVDADMSKKDVSSMMDKIDNVKGIKYVLGMESAVGPAVPDEMLPSELESTVKSSDYQLLIINSRYSVASDKVNNQIDEINELVADYDREGILIGEAPCTKDLITITDRDFKVVNIISIAAIFIIIAIVLKSISLPFILVSVIELAIFINLGIPHYTGTVLPFIASICISTIQLGATVDYAILMTTRYRQERYAGREKREAISIAHAKSMPSILVSALGFFAATFGVALYSKVDIIGSLCSLMSRGALISMLVVMLILPSMFVIFDNLICKTSKGFVNKEKLCTVGGESYEK